jgi:alpha-ribazole phosphatase
VIALVRHPPVAGAGRCYGRTDLPLADPASAAALAARLAPLGGTVWTSPALRCRAVAEALGTHRVDDQLQELDFGAWENRPWDDVPRAALDAWAADPWGFSPPGGESGSALAARVTAFCDALARGTHVVITHGGPLKVLTALLQRRPIELLSAAPPPGSIQLVPLVAIGSSVPASSVA